MMKQKNEKSVQKQFKTKLKLNDREQLISILHWNGNSKKEQKL